VPSPIGRSRERSGEHIATDDKHAHHQRANQCALETERSQPADDRQRGNVWVDEKNLQIAMDK
jgi:hypothetical protein